MACVVTATVGAPAMGQTISPTPLPAPATPATSPQVDYVPGELIVRFKPGTAAAERSCAERRAKAHVCSVVYCCRAATS